MALFLFVAATLLAFAHLAATGSALAILFYLPGAIYCASVLVRAARRDLRVPTSIVSGAIAAAFLAILGTSACASTRSAIGGIRTLAQTRELQAESFARHYYALGDSITHGYLVQDPEVYGYPARVADHFGFRLTNLGIDGWTSAGVIQNELPAVTGSCALATLDIGTNDADGIQDGVFTVAQYERNVRYIVGTLRMRCQRVAVLGLIENPYTYTGPIYQSAEVEMNAFLASLPSVTFVDLDADRRLHDWNDFAFPGSLHPNAAGDGAMAEDISHELLYPQRRE